MLRILSAKILPVLPGGKIDGNYFVLGDKLNNVKTFLFSVERIGKVSIYYYKVAHPRHGSNVNSGAPARQ